MPDIEQGGRLPEGDVGLSPQPVSRSAESADGLAALVGSTVPQDSGPDALSAAPFDLADFCKENEAYETERWALESILEVELMTPLVIDPCAGTGMISRVASEHGHRVLAMDLVDWSALLPESHIHWGHVHVCDFLAEPNSEGTARYLSHVDGATVFMNPPFSLACQFVDRALALGARKVISFQRQAWRESADRRAWWEKIPPARVWVCGSRVSCWRFDMLGCSDADGVETCPGRAKDKTFKAVGCRHCKGNSSTSNAFYVWERGHKGAELTSAIYPMAKP